MAGHTTVNGQVPARRAGRRGEVLGPDPSRGSTQLCVDPPPGGPSGAGVHDAAATGGGAARSVLVGVARIGPRRLLVAYQWQGRTGCGVEPEHHQSGAPRDAGGLGGRSGRDGGLVDPQLRIALRLRPGGRGGTGLEVEDARRRRRRRAPRRPSTRAAGPDARSRPGRAPTARRRTATRWPTAGGCGRRARRGTEPGRHAQRRAPAPTARAPRTPATPRPGPGRRRAPRGRRAAAPRATASARTCTSEPNPSAVVRGVSARASRDRNHRSGQSRRAARAEPLSATGSAAGRTGAVPGVHGRTPHHRSGSAPGMRTGAFGRQQREPAGRRRPEPGDDCGSVSARRSEAASAGGREGP